MLSDIATASNFLLPAVNDWLGWIAAGLIVVVGLLVYGFADVRRLSPRRVWALGGVSFRDAVRRRVLWVAPLAMLGVVIVTQFINPVDELDAVRQTIKYGLFATGLVVIVVTIILGCTSLPREIESRVIYTVVTKPTTRLEIVLGKWVGYARVSALILLLMGAFTWGHVRLRAWSLQGDIAEQLEGRGDADDPSRAAWLRHFADGGLLAARDLVRPTNFQVYARLPDVPTADQPGRRYMYAAPMDFLVPFTVTREQLESAVAEPGAAEPAGPGASLLLHVGYEPLETDAPAAVDVPTPLALPDPAARVPRVSVELLDAEAFSSPDSVLLPEPVALPADPSGETPVTIPVTPAVAAAMADHGRFFIRVSGVEAGFLYAAGPQVPVTLLVPDPANPQAPREIAPTTSPESAAGGGAAIFRGGDARLGMQVAGPAGARQSVAVFRFAGADVSGVARDGRVPMELVVGIERSGDDEATTDVTAVEVSVRNRATGAVSTPELVFPETGRTAYFTAPADALAGGDFDVILRTRTPGHVAGVTGASVAVVAGVEPFAWNLLKGLTATWLLSLLVVAVALFTSTFVSWPIAVVLTLVILMGNWTVTQLGGALGPGVGRQIGGDLFDNPAQTRVATETIETLTRTVTALSQVLPDLTAFAAGDYVERGLSVPMAVFARSALVLLGFGLPLLTMAYVFLRNKEVAP